MPRKYQPLEYHGHRKRGYRSPTYTSWEGMRNRCNNPKSVQYSNYGGRGISVCGEWDSFSVFLEEMGERPLGKSLERIDNNKGYSKENCKWATKEEQCWNRSTTYKISFKGVIYNLTQLVKLTEVNINYLRNNLKTGMSVEEAISKAKVRKAG